MFKILLKSQSNLFIFTAYNSFKMKYWIVKSDSETYSWNDFERDHTTVWDGVRNFQARNYLKEMKLNDKALFYHSIEEKAIVGIAKISKEFFNDPTDSTEKWVAVELTLSEKFKSPVSLNTIKNTPELQNIKLLKQQRLSVMPITESEFNKIIQLSK